jgi:hypothetical protein
MLNEKTGAMTPSRLATSLGIDIAYVCAAQGGAWAHGACGGTHRQQKAVTHRLDARDNLIKRDHLLDLPKETHHNVSADQQITESHGFRALRP